MQNHNKGFTFIEITISILVLSIIGLLGIYAFLNTRNNKTLDIVSNNLVSTLEKAKSEALAGKDGLAYGVYVASTSFVYFSGSTYNPSDTQNRYTAIDSGWRLATTSSSGGSEFVFRRLSGNPTATGTITIINLSNTSQQRKVTIGQTGNISVIK